VINGTIPEYLITNIIQNYGKQALLRKEVFKMLPSLNEKAKFIGFILKIVVVITFSLIVTACNNTGNDSTPEPVITEQQTTEPVQTTNYQIRVEFTSTGDYAELEIYNAEDILSADLVSVSGEPSLQEVSEEHLELNQSIDAAKDDVEVGLTVDYEIDASASSGRLDFRLQCGLINSCWVRIYQPGGGGFQLVHEQEYQRKRVPIGQLHLDFSLDLVAMASVLPPSQLTPTPTQAPNIEIRVEFTSSADWADFRILNSGDILSVRVKSLIGSPSWYDVKPEDLAVDQPLSEAESGGTVGLTVDYVIDPAAIGEPLKLQLQRGSINQCAVRIYHLRGEDYHLIQEVVNDVNTGLDVRNTLDFSLDLSRIAEVDLSGDHCSRFDGLDLDLVLHTIEPDDTLLTMYAKFPDKVIGVEGEVVPIVYHAQLGDSPGLECRMYQGDLYAGRLYCFHELGSGDKNSNLPWFLYAEGCNEPVFIEPYLSLRTSKPVVEADKDVEEAAANPCGPTPEGCNREYNEWCKCQGLIFVCYVSASGAVGYCREP
jgi:hypothetical protein